MENKNVLRALTKSIFSHTQNSSGFTTHSLVSVLGTLICKYAWEPHQTVNSSLYGIIPNGQVTKNIGNVSPNCPWAAQHLSWVS